MNVEVSGEEANLLEGTGLQTLNGRQAVAYMRIRKVGNGDYERMERQRRVITLVAQKAFSYNKVKLLGLMNDFLPSFPLLNENFLFPRFDLGYLYILINYY